MAIVASAAAGPSRAAAPRRDPAARIAFAGVPWLAPADSALGRLEASGFRAVKGGRTREALVVEGRLQGLWGTARADLDSLGRVVRWVVVLPGADGSSYPPARAAYDRIVHELGARHGAPVVRVDRFDFPYRRGDGREGSALAQGLGQVRSEWLSKGGDRVSVEITRELAVVLVYTPREWSEAERRRLQREASRL